MEITIGHYSIGPSSPPFIIAEMSGNHNHSLERALHIVEAAAKSGAHAVKLQTYTAETMTLNVSHGEFLIQDPNSLWAGRNLYDLYNEAYTPWEWHKPIFDRCKELGLVCFSTPFDATAVDFLETLDVPAYKIASFENTDIPLIRKVAATGKPLIISTGMASISELDETVGEARAAGCRDLILLKCTSTYPASPMSTNIRTIPHLRQTFGCEVGLSDHTMGVGVAVASIALGATVIEKHVTLSRAEGGVDSAFSLEPEELRALVTETERAWQSLGRIVYGPTDQEKPSMVFRRSLYFVRDIQAGEIITSDDLRAIRPGHGLAPKFYDWVIGRRTAVDVAKGTPVTWNSLS
ncbi:pseudaminic acid synthase [Paenibacillus thiaminolyticus]|uniref:pseudaminic acid synthase n=1 Tax=Paenibacillus thiaminolyticus TaxID=49283 RepID=UPI00232FC9EC|nr:pseudaminic acid synthase [Paenibacillus thiaminolyticus]WCF07923.1 pseudaminic acid synthase [Paenibacillus thiaminolyticus]